MATAIIGVALVAVVALIIRNMINKKKRGEGGCGCGCSGCSMGCHETHTQGETKK